MAAPPESLSPRTRQIIFIHLDLGIGGAEQLVLNLATASLPFSSSIKIYTSHCDQNHCFSPVKKPDGILSSNVQIRGSTIPYTFLGKGTALFSTLRIMYLTWKAIRENPSADLFVLDVLPTSIPLIKLLHRGGAAVLYYCHFPDKLLTRDTVNGVVVEDNDKSMLQQQQRDGVMKTLRSGYRRSLDWVEEFTMRYADSIAVNSIFTKGEVKRVFPSMERVCMEVLYPAIDLTKFIEPDFQSSSSSKIGPIVSLNRFERKKNIQILIQAYAQILQNHSSASSLLPSQIPNLIIAGGYDPQNLENRQYLEELRHLAFSTLSLPPEKVSFSPSISDETRATLLRSASCVCYTPLREHFGIVPLEAMYAGSPVVAVRSGGPCETVLHGETGVLVEGSANGFAQGVLRVLEEGKKVMGRRGHEHVKEKFGLDKFVRDWEVMVNECLKRVESGGKKAGFTVFSGNAFLVVLELLFVVILAYFLNYFLKSIGFL